jgi:hypothetical protein
VSPDSALYPGPSARHVDVLLGAFLPVADDVLALFEVVAVENEANRRVEHRLFDVWVVPAIRSVTFHPRDRMLDTPRCRLGLRLAIFAGSFHGLNLVAESVYTIVEDGDTDTVGNTEEDTDRSLCRLSSPDVAVLVRLRHMVPPIHLCREVESVGEWWSVDHAA